MSAEPRLTVALTFDHDAISDSVRRGDSPVKFSHAEFGHRVGCAGSSSCWSASAIPTTWFVPGHTLVTFPDDTAAILAGGHELACHGWFHEDFSELDGRGAARRPRPIGRGGPRATGAPPKGFRAPYWALGRGDARARRGGRASPTTRSLMADDYRPYRVRHGDRHYRRGRLDLGPRERRSSRSRSTGRSTTGRTSSRAEAATGCRRRPRCSRSGPASCATPTRHAPGGLLTVTDASRSASAAATGWRCSRRSSPRRRPCSTASSSTASTVPRPLAGDPRRPASSRARLEDASNIGRVSRRCRCSAGSGGTCRGA